MEILEYIGSIGGIAGVLAFLMFLIYRTDHKTNATMLTELIKSLALEQAQIVKAYNDTCREYTAAVIKNTEVNTELFTWLKRRNGHTD